MNEIIKSCDMGDICVIYPSEISSNSSTKSKNFLFVLKKFDEDNNCQFEIMKWDILLH